MKIELGQVIESISDIDLDTQYLVVVIDYDPGEEIDVNIVTGAELLAEFPDLEDMFLKLHDLDIKVTKLTLV